MSLQAAIRTILPQEVVFYDLLERQGSLLLDAARALCRFADGAPAREVHAAVRELEHAADGVVHETEELLAKIFVTPLDREDIQHLSTALDDPMDFINVTARSLDLYAVPRATPPMQRMMRLLVVLAEILQQHLPALRRHDYRQFIELGRKVKRHEKEGDAVFRGAISELFTDRDLDAKSLIRDKEVLEDLEHAINSFEALSERLRNLAVKHG